MKKWLTSLALTALLVQTVDAWQPAGWICFQWPWAYDHASGDWYWFGSDSGHAQWVHGYPPADGWRSLSESGLARGWSWHAWPYAFSHASSAWYFFDAGLTQWCVNMRTGAWSTLGTPIATPDMALIPAGPFQMGDSFGEGNATERPVHTVFVSAFYLDQCEVTKAQWNEVKKHRGGNGYTYAHAGEGRAADHPVQTISWMDAVKWCNARSERDGLKPVYYTDSSFVRVYRTGELIPTPNWGANGYRLPTEAEWEKAARGGAEGRRFPWSDSNWIDHSRANYFSNWTVDGARHPWYDYDKATQEGYNPIWGTGGYPATCPVGTFAPNGYGLHEMAGNIWELCWDVLAGNLDSDRYPTSPTTDPRGLPSNDPSLARALRGGNCNFDPSEATCASRDNFQPNFVSCIVGFRCARRAE